MFRWIDDLNVLRELAQSNSMCDLLQGTCSSEFAHWFDDLVLRTSSLRSTRIDASILDELVTRLHRVGISRKNLERYCKEHYPDELFLYYFLLVCLYVFRPQVGITLAPEAVVRNCPNLLFDNRGLLVGPADQVSFAMDGVLAGNYLLGYHADLTRYNLSLPSGFLDILCRLRQRPDIERFGLAIDPDLVIDTSYRRDGMGSFLGKRYISGPKSLSVAHLRNPSFPERASGTITEHRRVDGVPRYFMVDRFLVMWTQSNGLKTVQMEELVPIESDLFTPEAWVANRFVHAQWDGARERFVHFDGAVRIYDKKSYRDRLPIRQVSQSSVGAAQYRKVFRIDALLVLDEWADLTIKFFDGNELVEEYFHGDAPYAVE